MFRADPPDGDDFDEQREKMVDALVGAGRLDDETVIEALKAVPRHEFVPEARRDRAYIDRPLPIGSDQTVSAPHIVGIMSELLELEDGDEVLEIGTGCGYHAAVTAEIVGDENVYSVEYLDELAEDARETLSELGYDIEIRVGDGHEGWSEHAPYDAAYLTCAAAEIPEGIVDQLRGGGIFVGPIGTAEQRLIKATKTETGLDREDHGGVRFVRMQGD
ncbi:protein-L-isoaspartate(D-aspartate) O-methyltransferase [Natronomonas halophila]|uniref:protein-L-isoaspartate(D-aspartate) O-methyltransferase n=1 Tax=Natronomonas halophila TaxID=2747817 RepID=UPI0015B65385|nr:protein-L-isoaspartate(D-aspartate) O-methyltransferase [Natronomonas halophila]QLD86328.1 protein-L-isoaspartate(D-aspartate) O-methyltransferase [Natronomonas halophila]